MRSDAGSWQQFMSEPDLTSRVDRIERDLESVARDRAKTERTLRRAIALGVQEARRQRARSRELDEKFDRKMDQLASAQLLTEEKLRAFIDSQNAPA